MSKKGVILMLLIFSWPVNNLHRLLNNVDTPEIFWYPCNPSRHENLQWYVHDVGQCISYLLIFIAIYLYVEYPKRKDPDINALFGGLLINQIIDLPHYMGWHRSSEMILLIQCAIIVYITLKIFIKHYRNGQTHKIK